MPTNVYAQAVILDNSVGNQDNALSNDDSTTASLNSNTDQLVLQMGQAINSGDSVTVNGQNGDDVDVWVSSSWGGSIGATTWTQVGVNAQLDFTFNSPIDWEYIRIERGDNVGTENISFIDASTTTTVCLNDSDLDGVADIDDLDDDNDGILDTDEGCTQLPASPFSLNSSLSVVGDVDTPGRLVYEDTNGNQVILTAAGEDGTNNGLGVGPNDGTIINNTTTGQMFFEVGGGDINDQPKLLIEAFSASGTPFDIASIAFGDVGNMDNSTARDIVAADVPGTWSNLTSGSNTLAVMQMTATGATPVSGITQTQINTFELNNFISQGAVSEAILNNGDNSIQFGYNATFNPETPTNSFNIIVDDAEASDSAGRNIVAEFRATAISVTGVVCQDTDNDGIPDYLDLDSDGDGCPDALEANPTLNYSDLNSDGSINASVGSSTDTNPGVPNNSPATDAGTSQDPTQQADECDPCNSTSTLFTDNDNDNIGDACDLDNDNDGILDADEDATCGITNTILLFQDFGAAANATPSSSVTLASLNPGITTAYGYDALSNPYAGNDLNDDFYSVFNNIPESASWASSGSERWQNIGDKTAGGSAPTADRMLMVNAGNTLDAIYQQTLTGVGAGALIDVSFWVLNLDVDKPSNDGRGLPNLQVELWQNGALLGTPVNTGDIPRETKGDVNAWKEYKTANSLVALDNSDVTLIIRNNLSETNGNDLAIDDILVVQHCDTDGDGTPNYLDTDSDNDGCFDALEGNGGVLATQVDASTGMITNPVNDNGIPVGPGTAGNGITGQDDVSSTNVAVSGDQCDDDGDGVLNVNDICNGFDDNADIDGDNVPDGCDLDNDNDGILDSDEICNLIVNGSFELQDFSSQAEFPDQVNTEASGTFIGTTYNSNTLTGWDFTHNIDGWVEGESPKWSSFTFADAFHGKQYLDVLGANDVTGGANNVLSQTIETVPGKSYTFAFSWGEDVGHSNGDLVDLDVSVVDASNNIILSQNLTATAQGEVGGVIGPKTWFTFSQVFVATTTQTTVRFSATPPSGSTAAGAALDSVSVVDNDCVDDVDGDGIPNYLDLDSDGDGCPDAIEAAGTFEVSDLEDSSLDGGNTGSSYTGTAGPVIQNLGNTVNANGIPISATGGTTSGTETTGQDSAAAVFDDSVNACIADLSLIKTVDNALPKIGGNIVYTLTVTNNSSFNATGVQVTDVLPAGLTYVSHTTGQSFTDSGDADTQRDLWTIGGLNANQSIVLQITATVTSAGTIINNAEITQSNQTDSDSTPDNGN
ncbi:DUF642 domain-containing protein [Tenacibaculum aquimarinum]|uniref:DUF642 domain-containing protein n=1 Tax=Tenacibaculum aquimarinum TaxID=2910675 RepID=UPI001F0A5DDF|nr:DUF642 domain-containing protein [Tenacibaculum aquimarinum]MCH3885549.1 DUF642 domain-containing protein [Tenacibaculum aquimarinum]